MVKLQISKKRADYTNKVSVYADLYVTDNTSDILYISVVGDEKKLKALTTGVTYVNKGTSTITSVFIPSRYFWKINRNGSLSHFVAIRKPFIDKDGNIDTILLSKDLEIRSNREISDLSPSKVPDDIAECLFNTISKYTSIPFLKEWSKSIFTRLGALSYTILYNNDFERKDNKKCDAESANLGFKILINLKIKESDFISAVSSALISKEISIQGCDKSSDLIKYNTNSFDEYLNNFAGSLQNKINEKFKPKFNPETDDYDQEVQDISTVIKYNTPIDLYDAQKNVVQGVVTNMDKNKHTIISSECGSGKTVMSIASICAHAKKHSNQAYTTLVMCPGHITGNNVDEKDSDAIDEDGWKKEIELIAPMSEAVVINSLKEFIALEDKIKDKNRKRSLWIIMSKDIIKSSYSMRPAAIPRKLINGTTVYLCPNCMKVLKTNERVGHGNKSFVADRFLNDQDFVKQYSYNTHCNVVDKENDCCGESLWTACTHENSSDWVKFSNGWYHKSRLDDLAKDYTEVAKYDSKSKKSKDANKFLDDYDKYKKGLIKSPSAPRKYSISEYIRKRFKNEIDYAIFDEVHELAGDSIQGKALADICRNVWKTLSLTGTLFNGKAEFIFYLMYRFRSNNMIREGYGYDERTKFSNDFGVTKKTNIDSVRFLKTVDPKDERVNRYIVNPNKKILPNTKRLPGISPLIFSRYLLNMTVFLKLKDISNSLAPYKEYPIPVDMDNDLKNSYTYISEEAVGLAKVDGVVRISGNKSLANAIIFMDMFLDQPYGLGALTDPVTGELAFDPINLDKDTLRNKEIELIKICKEKKEKGEKFLIYYHWSNKLRIADRLTYILKNSGINVVNMTNDVKNNTRQRWILEKTEDYDGVILNPSLIQTGANLLPYTTIIFYETGTIASTMRQASRRSWRLNQDKPISVYFMYYKDTVQEQTLSLMSSKLKAAAAIEGDFSENGLECLSQTDDIITELANNLIKGDSGNFTVDADSLEQNGLDEETYKELAEERLNKIKNRRNRVKDISLFKVSKPKKKTSSLDDALNKLLA